MGYSMRTDRYRYTESVIPETDFIERELYDHEVDPKENVNIANQTENTELVKKLARQLHEGWQKALPN